MELIDAIVLGIIQGLTEFLPISSSGHLELGKVILGQEIQVGLLFSVLLHAATALSTIVVFRKDIIALLMGLLQFKWNEPTAFTAKLVISMVPVLFVGLLLKDEIESLFDGRVLLVGLMLLVTGFLLLFTHYVRNQSGTSVSYFKAFIIGLAQAVAVLPGISRSGATIATALLLGVDKGKAAQFSFLMVLAPILGASLLEMKDYLEAPAGSQSLDITALAAGFAAAFFTGLAACTWMIRLVKGGKLSYFAIYCFVVGGIAIGYSLLF